MSEQITDHASMINPPKTLEEARIAERRAKRDEEARAKYARGELTRDLSAVNRTIDLLRVKSKIGPAEACEALARDIRKKLDEMK